MPLAGLAENASPPSPLGPPSRLGAGMMPVRVGEALGRWYGGDRAPTGGVFSEPRL